MACYFPVQLKKPFNEKYPLGTLTVPCGRCEGCLLERSRQWAVRCMHEHQMRESSLFITLTYTDEELPWGKYRPTLAKPHLQKFFKRLRRWYHKKYPKAEPLSYFACGEYGSKTNRPHYHAIVFGLTLDDLLLYTITSAQKELYTSKTLDKIWTHGQTYIGDVTFESCAYVARYTLKKNYGKTAVIYNEEGYCPEFVNMSLKNAIGKTWLDKYFTDVFPHDKVITRGGIILKTPRYYLKLLEKKNPTLYQSIMDARRIISQSQSFYDSQTPLKLNAKRIIKLSQTKTLKREYES